MKTSEDITISETERTCRQEAVDYARASIVLEGFALTPDQEHRARAFVNGDLTLTEFVSEAGDQ